MGFSYQPGATNKITLTLRQEQGTDHVTFYAYRDGDEIKVRNDVVDISLAFAGPDMPVENVQWSRDFRSVLIAPRGSLRQEKLPVSTDLPKLAWARLAGEFSSNGITNRLFTAIDHYRIHKVALERQAADLARAKERMRKFKARGTEAKLEPDLSK